MRLKRFHVVLAMMLALCGVVRAGELQEQIDSAIAAGQREIVIAPGVYRLPAKVSQPQLLIKGARDMRIVADGVTVVATTANQAVRMQDCQNVEIRGLSIDYDPLPFTQGVIVAAGDDGTWMDVRIDAGYPAAKAENRRRAIVHDPVTGLVKANTWTRFGITVTPKEDGLARISWPVTVRDTAAVGDRISITQQIQSPHGFMVERCTECTLRNVTALASTSFGIFESHGGGNKYIGCAVRPGLPPQGATATRLLSSNADGFHSKRAMRGPVVENCTLEGMGDDGIAINGEFVLVAAGSGNKVIVSPQFQMPFAMGDRLHGISREGLPTADATIVAMTLIEMKEAPDAKAIQLKYYPNLRLVEDAFKKCYEVELDRPLPLSEGYLAASPDRNGSGFVVRNNVVRDTRARGILIKASYGVIESNRIEQIALAGIVLCPETKYWHEADYSTDVVIQKNTLRNVLGAPVNPELMQAGAITVCSEGNGRRPGPAGGHRNIRIEENRIEGAPGVQVLVTSAKDVRVRGNVFVNPAPSAEGNGAVYGVDAMKTVWWTESENVVVEGNVVGN